MQLFFSYNLRFLRKGNNLTLEAIAARLNQSKEIIKKWEYDEDIPSLMEVVALCKYFGVGITEFLERKLNITSSAPFPGERERSFIDKVEDLNRVIAAKDQVIENQVLTIEIQKELFGAKCLVKDLTEQNDRLKTDKKH